MMSTKPNVIIIGAGAAGIAAATRLLEEGIEDIQVLEAENRIGGRIHSKEFGNSTLDIGAQWVHGEEGNLVFELVKDFDLLSPSFNDYKDNTFYLSTGEAVDKELTDQLFATLMEIVNDEGSYDCCFGSFGEYVIKEFKERTEAKFGNDRESLQIAKMLLKWFSVYFICYDSAESWFEFTPRSLFAFKECEGYQQLNWRNKGYNTILDVLMRKIPDAAKRLPVEEKIILNKRVTRISWDGLSGCTKNAVVECSDNTTYSADYVIVTVSLGVLKEFHSKMFSPQLPLYKINSIEGLRFGALVKIFVKFPVKWWPNDVKGFSLLWTEEDRRNLIEECPFYEPSIDGRSWLEDVFGFYVIDAHPLVLLGWVVGKIAAEVEQMSEEMLKGGCLYLLKKFSGGAYNVAESDEILRSTWRTNPNFLGTYSYHSSVTERTGASPQDLAEPLKSSRGEEVLLFAGEATSTERYSTVDGAIATGFREANRILDRYRKSVHRKIAIVGAGMAGLGAALKFQEFNIHDFIIVEAGNNPGGRIKTIYVNDKPLDLGAQWLHGRDNPLFSLAMKHHLLAEETSEEGLGIFVRNDGTIIDQDIAKRVNWEVGVILEQCRSFMEKEEYPRSVGNYLEKKFKEYLDSYDDDYETKEIKKQLFDWNLRFQVVDNSCHSLKKLSARYWGSYVCLDDTAHYNLKYGYKSLIDVMVERLPHDCFLYNTTVKKINYGAAKIILETTNGTITCDHLVLTPSLGVLKRLLTVSPPLPNNIKGTIDAMGFDGIGKIFLFFKERWWGNIQGFQFVFNSELVLEKDERWVRYLTGFDDVFNHPNVLIGWVGSDGVKQIEEQDEDLIGDICVKILRQFLPGYEVSEPIKVIRTRWLSNPLTLGSYSHITPECDSGMGIEGLREPVRSPDGVPKLLLAGEAIHPSHYSTTHGAFESGMEQATVLAEYINGNIDGNDVK